MKTNFTRLLRRGLVFSGLALGSTLLYNCSTKDLEFIDPYEFAFEEFEQVEMVPVADPEPSFDEPETGEVAGAAGTQAIIEDVTTADALEDIDASTRTAQDIINDFSQGLSAEVLAIAAELDTDAAANILDPDTDLNPALVTLVDQLLESPEALQELLSSVEFICSAEDVQALLKAANKGKIIINPSDLEPMAQSTLFGPCSDAAQEAYDNAVEGVIVQRDENLALIDSNEDTRLTDADTRFDVRVAQQEEDYATNEAAILATVEGLLSAVDAAVALGDEELAEELRLLALFYAVNGRTDLLEWNTSVMECLEALLAEEIAFIEQLAAERTAQVFASYEAATAEADALLADILNNCHNQGAGN